MAVRPRTRRARSMEEQRRHAMSVVPLALHVDYYWNGLGWTDRFLAVPRFHRASADALPILPAATTLYTPEVFVGGREVADVVAAGRFQNRVDKLIAEPAQASIALDIKPRPRRRVRSRGPLRRPDCG